MKKQKSYIILPDDYFLPRDFEIVQPIYDLAFLLKIKGPQDESSVPNYRVRSLSMAAHNLDGYSTSISKWLIGIFDDNDLDYVPSNRIRDLLFSIKDTGKIPELDDLLTPEAEGCIRLRSIRGLGLKLISAFLQEVEPTDELLTAATRRCGLAQEDVLKIIQGRLERLWEASHIVPPLMRLLKRFEDNLACKQKWKIEGIANGILPIEDHFKVSMVFEDNKACQDIVKSVVNSDPFFELKVFSDLNYTIQHQMGWLFEISFVNNLKRYVYLTEIISDLDPLVRALPGFLRADLHTHTSWSDGIATPVTMIKSAEKIGLEYIAVTDHSRSSKLQSGLTPSTWLRQGMSISLMRNEKLVLHGMEVDILNNGNLDMPEGILRGMDIVVASIHANMHGSENANTNRFIKAIESGYIDVIGHPTTTLLGRPGEPEYVRPPIKVDWNTVFEYCSRWQVALEINCFPSRLDLSCDLVKKAVDAGCWLSIGTDAHSRYHLEAMKLGAEICKLAKVQKKILNSFRFEELLEWLKEARAVRGEMTRTQHEQKQITMFDDPKAHTTKSSPLEAGLNGRTRVPEGSDVIGIDLTDGKNKKTGIALLSGMNVETISLQTDEDILNYIVEKKPGIVSIDSPLGLPGGGKDIDTEAGIVRMAERHLSSVGIPSYPALIDSMKGLTLRGIRLRKMIEELNDAPIVIESYPGAAQDLLCIPRKQKGLNLLREGQKELGLLGPGLETSSHDEMDAITSAIVGRFFEAGQYEGMGVESEAQLIVPMTSVLTLNKPPLICIAGKTGVGKSVVSRYLALYYGFKWIKTRDIIFNMIKEDFDSISTQKLKLTNNSQITETHLREFGRIIMAQYDQVPLKKRVTEKILSHSGSIVVDSVRSIDDVDTIRTRNQIYTWYISCPEALILERWVGRKNGKEDYSLYRGTIDVNSDIIMQQADTILNNDGTLENLHRSIDDILFSQIIQIKRD